MKPRIPRLTGIVLLLVSLTGWCDDEIAREPEPGQSEYVARAERMLAAAIDSGDDLGTAQAQHELARHMKTLSLYPQALTHASLAREAARDIDDAHMRVAIDITYASVLAQLDRTAEATEILLASLEQARTLGDVEQEQWALLGLSSAYVSARQLEKAEDFGQQGLALARAGDDRVQEVRFLSNLGLISWTAGDAARAEARIQTATAVDAGELPPDVHKTLILASITLAGTAGEASAARAREVIDQARRDGSRYMEGFATEQLGHILCGNGESDEGLQAFASADLLFRESDRLGDLWRLHDRWAQCLEGAGRPIDALEHQREAMELLDAVHERRQRETLQAHDIAFRTEQRMTELARLTNAEQTLQTRIARQRAFTGWMTAGILLLLGTLYGLWARNRRLREHRDAQAALQQARIDLLARTSHEIRNPAQGIIGILESRDLQTGEGADACHDDGHDACHDNRHDNRHLDAALAAARMIGHLSSDYLDLALLEQGRLRIDTGAVCDLPALVGRVETLSRSFIKSPRQTLTTRIDERVPDRIHADGERLVQVLLNLISNAAYYGEAGEIGFEVAIDDQTHRLRFDVTDCGPGFGTAGAAGFDPYVRADVYQDNPRGSGLGLAVSARIVDAMGGCINARNRPSGGTVVSVSVPLHAAGDAPDTAAHARPVPVAEAPAGRRVLIVDDDPFARLGLKTLAESVGARVEELASGNELDRIIDRFDPEVVLLDYRLGEASGIDLAERIRQRDESRPGTARKILVVSGSDDSADPPDTDGIIDGWLVKPVGRATMIKLLA